MTAFVIATNTDFKSKIVHIERPSRRGRLKVSVKAGVGCRVVALSEAIFFREWREREVLFFYETLGLLNFQKVYIFK